MTNFSAFDILVIGSGAAGLTLALHLPEHLNIGLLSKGPLTLANTYYAQGGVAAVLDQEDSTEVHIQDTLNAGAGLCHEHSVRQIIENGPKAVSWLAAMGVNFTPATSTTQQTIGSDTHKQPYHLTREGGHSHRRVLHVADATGLAISTTLTNKILAKPNINLLEEHIAIDLITTHSINKTQAQNLPTRCLGAYVLDKKTQRIHTIAAQCTILACGGASKAYLYTSNPDVATGDGIAMAWRAGCRVMNLEFNQFHPTCLYHPQSPCFLLTEALRGEGGYLRLPNGERFMYAFDERAELAPRDIVARAIDHEMKRLGINCVYLDISHKSSEFIQTTFPNIYQRLLNLGFNLSQDLIPVVPAAHYTCGGIKTTLTGRTDIKNLYAIGETACTGLHGANRMASNSLLECLVQGMQAAQEIINILPQTPSVKALPQWDESQVTDSDEDVVITHNWNELRRFMWDYVGIVRTNKRLQRAKHRIDLLQTEIQEYYSNYKISANLIELRNLVMVSDLIIRCAMQRKESRGLHYTLDYPSTLNTAEDSILTHT